MPRFFCVNMFGTFNEKSYLCNRIIHRNYSIPLQRIYEVLRTMISDNIRQMLPKLRAVLATQPVSEAWLFGSCSRGEERTDSDVDLLVRYIDSDSMSLMSIGRIRKSLEASIGRRVDLVEDGCLLPFATESANRDKILVYERKG